MLRSYVLAFALSGSALSPAFAADSPYPFRHGAKWVLRHNDSTLESLTEGFTTIKTDQGTLQAAVMRKSDATDRIVIRTSTQWIECQLKKDRQKGTACTNPFVFFQWPIAANDRWASRNFDFTVIGKEKVTTPFKEFNDAWRISYTPSGSPDPLGEFWFVEGVGRVRVREGEVDLLLSSYEPGSGPELAVSPDDVVTGFFSDAQAEEPKSETLGFWPRTWLLIRQSGLSPLFILQGLVLGVFLVLGLILWNVLRTQKNLLSEIPADFDVKGEARLLAALARGGETKAVEERLMKLVSENPTFPDLLHQLALVQRASGKLEEAGNSLKKAVELNPKYMDARLALGNLLLETGEARKAAEHFEFVVGERPQFADAHLGAGRSYFAMQRMEDARRSLETALRINPKLNPAEELLNECRKMAQTGPQS